MVRIEEGGRKGRPYGRPSGVGAGLVPARFHAGGRRSRPDDTGNCRSGHGC